MNHRGVRLLTPNAYYTLIDGRTLIARTDADEGGLVFVTYASTTEFVLRPSSSGGRPCTVLVERRWRVAAGGGLVAELVATDFTLEDVGNLDSGAVL